MNQMIRQIRISIRLFYKFMSKITIIFLGLLVGIIAQGAAWNDIFTGTHTIIKARSLLSLPSQEIPPTAATPTPSSTRPQALPSPASHSSATTPFSPPLSPSTPPSYPSMLHQFRSASKPTLPPTSVPSVTTTS